MKLAIHDYRTLLKEELEGRLKRNPRYSLRSFARDLNLSSARVSEILRGKSGLSRDRALDIARRLGLNTVETDYFADLVDSAHARSKVKRELARIRIQKHVVPFAQQIQMDAFKIVSDWYHFAILELTEVRGFKSDPLWIAQALGISAMEVKIALERLERLELIASHDGKLVATESFTASPDGVPSESIRKFHHQILEKAAIAIQIQPVEKRDFSSLTLAIDPTKLPEAKQRIKEFRRDFYRYMSGFKDKRSVYCLGVQFFDLTSQNNKGVSP